jgi:hypothetical protein
MIQNWYNVTIAAQENWQLALARYYEERYGPNFDERRIAALEARLNNDRAHYRHLVLSWYWKLLTPMKIGECVPDEVALLLAEDWDSKTGDQPGRG